MGSNLKSLSLGLLLGLFAFSQQGNAKDVREDYPRIPPAAERTGPRFVHAPLFPDEEIKFVGTENGVTTYYEKTMARYLSQQTIADVKNRNLEWLIVRNAVVDQEYREANASGIVQYPLIVDMRYVQPLISNSSVNANATLHVAYLVSEENGVPSKVELLKFEFQPIIAAPLGYWIDVESLMNNVVGDTVRTIYRLSDTNRLP